MARNTTPVRDFLRVVLAAYAEGKLLTSETVREVAAEFGLGQDDPDKIANLLDVAREVVALRTEGGPRNAIVAKMEEVSALAVAQFDIASAPYDLCQTLLDEPTKLGLVMDDLTEEQLRPLIDGIVPIAVIRALIRQHRAAANDRQGSAFTAFLRVASGPVVGRIMVMASGTR